MAASLSGTWTRRMTVRHWSLAGLAFCALMMAVALALQYVAGLEPCPLCWLQRFGFMGAGLVSFLAFLHGLGGGKAGGVQAQAAQKNGP